jgi:hypothetical protein
LQPESFQLKILSKAVIKLFERHLQFLIAQKEHTKALPIIYAFDAHSEAVYWHMLIMLLPINFQFVVMLPKFAIDFMMYGKIQHLFSPFSEAQHEKRIKLSEVEANFHAFICRQFHNNDAKLLHFVTRRS